MELLSHFFPALLLEHFEIKGFKELCDLSTKSIFFEVDMEELNHLPSGYSPSDYESKGFFSSAKVQDFPIRGKSVYLHIRRRRWREKQTKKQIVSNYSFIAEGARLTQELSAFLKCADQYPREYDK